VPGTCLAPSGEFFSIEEPIEAAGFAGRIGGDGPGLPVRIAAWKVAQGKQDDAGQRVQPIVEYGVFPA
jgi:hypothetical protein